MAAIILAISGLGGVWIGRASVKSAPSASPSELQHLLLQFEPSPGAVPYCATYFGVGMIPRGYRLLIFDSPRQGTDKAYYLDPPIVHNAQQKDWSVSPVTIGSEQGGAGFKAELTGVLVTTQAAQFLRSIFGVGPSTVQEGSLAWKSSNLPPSPAPYIHLDVMRNGKHGSC